MKGSGDEATEAPDPGLERDSTAPETAWAGAGRSRPVGRPTWVGFAGKASGSVRTLLSIWSTLMASRDDGGQGGHQRGGNGNGTEGSGSGLQAFYSQNLGPHGFWNAEVEIIVGRVDPQSGHTTNRPCSCSHIE